MLELMLFEDRRLIRNLLFSVVAVGKSLMAKLSVIPLQL